MNRDGMLPQHPCKQCAKPLNADGWHPAELYLGTYTGLCYSCQAGAPYHVTTYASGATLWNFAPHCPSWRRDRETFIGYSDCAKCGGKGRIMVSRANAQGGSYPINCQPCVDRHYSHPATKSEAAHAKDCAVMRHWSRIIAHGYKAADIALHDLIRTGHMTSAKAEKLILARRAKEAA